MHQNCTGTLKMSPASTYRHRQGGFQIVEWLAIQGELLKCVFLWYISSTFLKLSNYFILWARNYNGVPISPEIYEPWHPHNWPITRTNHSLHTWPVAQNIKECLCWSSTMVPGISMINKTWDIFLQPKSIKLWNFLVIVAGIEMSNIFLCQIYSGLSTWELAATYCGMSYTDAHLTVLSGLIFGDERESSAIMIIAYGWQKGEDLL